MQVRTKNSTYVFDPVTSLFRKILPIQGPWSVYVGWETEPKIGERLSIIQDINQKMVTSVVTEIVEDV